MQTLPTSWAALFAKAHKTEYRYDINGKTYYSDIVQGTPSIVKPLLDKPTIGRCCTGSLALTVYLDSGDIPKAATVDVYCRLSSQDGSIVTDWLPQGRFYVHTRSGIYPTQLNCLDYMVKAGTTYQDKTAYTEWPQTMTDVVDEICDIMDVDLDSRTVIQTGSDYKVAFPNEDTLISEILAMIAAAHGGNWIMTENGQLRLVALSSPADTVQQVLGRKHLGFTVQGKTQFVSAVALTDSADNEFYAGDDTGLTLSVRCDYATQGIVDTLSAAPSGAVALSKGLLSSDTGALSAGLLSLFLTDFSLSKGSLSQAAGSLLYGASWVPYTLDGAYLDPALELGDTIQVTDRKGNVYAVLLGSLTVACTKAYTCAASANSDGETEEEFPYISMQDLALSRAVRTDQTYYGNRITREDGFVSERILGDEVKARFMANADVFSMQVYENGQWRDRIYFDPVTAKYRIVGDVTIESVDALEAAAITGQTMHYLATNVYSGVTTATVGWTTTIQTVTATNRYLWTYITYTRGDGTTEDTAPVVSGVYGDTGSTGVGISSIIEYYALSSSASQEPDLWATTVPTMTSTNRYLWNYEHIVYTNGSTLSTTPAIIGVYGDTGPTGQTGANGVGVSATSVKYASSTSGTVIPSSETDWYTTVPAVAQGNYLWARTITSYTDGTSSTSYSVSYIGTDGDDGASVYVSSATKQNGVTTVILTETDGNTTTLTINDGEDGDTGAAGANGYVHTAWANSADGSTDFSTSVSTGKTYLGVYTDNTEADSQNPSVYSWSQIKGAKGDTGDTGVGIDHITEYYAVSSSATTAPTQWHSTVQTMSATNKFLWNYEEITYTDGSSFTSAPAVIGAYGDTGATGNTGATGVGIDYVTEYYAASASSTIAPTSWIENAVPQLTSTIKYLWNYERIVYTDGSSATTPTGVIGVYGDTGDTGNAGVGIREIVEHYLATPAKVGVTAETDGWTTETQTIDVVNKYLWNYETVIYTDESTSDTAPVIIGAYGDRGSDGDSFAWNLIFNTLEPEIVSTSARPAINGYANGYLDASAGTVYAATHGLGVTNTSAVRPYLRLGTSTAANASLYGLTAGQTYTLSFDAAWKLLSGITTEPMRLSAGLLSITSDSSSDALSKGLLSLTLDNAALQSGQLYEMAYHMVAYLFCDSVTTGTFDSAAYASMEFSTINTAGRGNDMTGRCEFTFTIPETATMLCLLIQCDNATASSYATGDYLELDNLKLEEGETATPWSPAFVDLSMSISSIQYAVGTSGTTAPSSGWQTTVPNVAQGQWLWSRTTYSDGTTADTCSYQGTDGEDGVSVAVSGVQKVGKVTTVTLTETDPETQQSTTYTLTINDGDDGTDGLPGATGYVHVAWANSADGSTGFSTSDSTGKTYLGVYTDNTATDSNNPTDYSWSLIKGANGANGANGDDGVSVVSITPLYYVSNSNTVAPTAPITHVVSTATATPLIWTQAIPAISNTYPYIWTCNEVLYDDNTVGTNGYEWTTVVLNDALSDIAGRLSAAELTVNDDSIKAIVQGYAQVGSRNLLPDTNAPTLEAVAASSNRNWSHTLSYFQNNYGTCWAEVGDYTASISISATYSSEVSLSSTTFFAKTDCVAGTYTFVYSSSAWYLDDTSVTLSDYGITVTGTRADDDTITVTVTLTKNTPLPEIVYGARIVHLTASNIEQEVTFYSTASVSFEANTDYTLSFYAKQVGGTGAQLCIDYDDATHVTQWQYATIRTADAWQRYEFVINEETAVAATRLWIGTTGNVAGTVWLCGFKLEEGDSAVGDWTPAPEDSQYTEQHLSSQIKQTTTEISTKVSAGDIASTINQTAQSVKIDANKIALGSALTISGSGDSSSISAIGGWYMNSNDFHSGSGTTYVAMNSNPSSTYAFWAGASTGASAPFSVTRAGYLSSSSGKIGPWYITADGEMAIYADSFNGVHTPISPESITATSYRYGFTKPNRVIWPYYTMGGLITDSTGNAMSALTSRASEISSNQCDIVAVGPFGSLYVGNYLFMYPGTRLLGDRVEATTLYVGSAQITGSDKTLKSDITEKLEQYRRFFSALKAVSFKRKSDESQRTHIGFVAQDVVEALETNGIDPNSVAFVQKCYGLKKDEETGRMEDDLDDWNYGLDYTQLAVLGMAVTQEHTGLIDNLQTAFSNAYNRLLDLQDKFSESETLIDTLQTKITESESVIDSLQDKITESQTTIEALTIALTDRDAQITAMQSTIDTLSGWRDKTLSILKKLFPLQPWDS